MSAITQSFSPKEFEKEFKERSLKRSDKLIEIFLVGYFVFGLGLAFFYDTWLIAVVSGGACLVLYFLAKKMFPGSNVHHYVASAILGIFTGQFIYQMHGLFEMHFFAFIGSALMITYQNWKTQIPVALVVIVHHALFGYLQWQSYLAGAENTVYFTQLDYMSLQTFIIHGILATIVFFICSLWSYEMDKRTNETIENSKNIMAVSEANESVSKNLEYAIMLSEGVLEEKIKYNEGDLMGEALRKIQQKISRN
jgi:methyl-accepting chemotaxis protein